MKIFAEKPVENINKGLVLTHSANHSDKTKAATREIFSKAIFVKFYFTLLDTEDRSVLSYHTTEFIQYK